MSCNNTRLWSKLGKLLCISANFWSAGSCLSGSSSYIRSGWEINSGHSGFCKTTYPFSCVAWSILAGVKGRGQSEGNPIIIEESEVNNLWEQYIDIFNRCIPVMRAVVSKELRIDASLIARYIGTKWSILWSAGGEKDFQFSGKELNEHFIDDLEENLESSAFFKQLVKMYYGIEVREFNLVDFEDATNNFLELRQMLFSIWMHLNMLVMMDRTDISKRLSSICTTRMGLSLDIERRINFENFLKQYGGQLPEDCDEDDIVAYVIRNYPEQAAEAFVGAQVFDRMRQEIDVDVYCESLHDGLVGVPAAGVFLFGMAESSYWKGKLYENFTFNAYYTKSIMCQEMYLLKSFFPALNGKQKCRLDVVLCSSTGSTRGHVKAWTPCKRPCISILNDNTSLSRLSDIKEKERLLEKLRLEAKQLTSVEQAQQFIKKVDSLRKHLADRREEQLKKRKEPMIIVTMPKTMEEKPPFSVLSNRDRECKFMDTGEDGFGVGDNFKTFFDNGNRLIGEIVSVIMESILQYTQTIDPKIVFYAVFNSVTVPSRDMSKVLSLLPSIIAKIIKQSGIKIAQQDIEVIVKNVSRFINEHSSERACLVKTPYDFLLDRCDALKELAESTIAIRGRR